MLRSRDMSEPMHFDVPDGDLPFTIGGESYAAHGAIPADDFPEFIAIVGELGGEKSDGEDTPDQPTHELIAGQLAVVKRALSYACPSDQAERLMANMAHGAEHPIPFPVVVKVLNWLMTEYGMGADAEDGDSDTEGAGVVRPLGQPSDSPDTSGATSAGSADA